MHVVGVFLIYVHEVKYNNIKNFYSIVAFSFYFISIILRFFWNLVNGSYGLYIVLWAKAIYLQVSLSGQVCQ